MVKRHLLGVCVCAALAYSCKGDGSESSSTPPAAKTEAPDEPKTEPKKEAKVIDAAPPVAAEPVVRTLGDVNDKSDDGETTNLRILLLGDRNVSAIQAIYNDHKKAGSSVMQSNKHPGLRYFSYTHKPKVTVHVFATDDKNGPANVSEGAENVDAILVVHKGAVKQPIKDAVSTVGKQTKKPPGGYLGHEDVGPFMAPYFSGMFGDEYSPKAALKAFDELVRAAHKRRAK